ncbi:hypothetical protein Ate01nite_28760 [Actinoplanes teichomyceticus]|nr:hypothetical protein Ate01nite_28760 [Actinoplanes teichomyceticus]
MQVGAEADEQLRYESGHTGVLDGVRNRGPCQAQQHEMTGSTTSDGCSRTGAARVAGDPAVAARRAAQPVDATSGRCVDVPRVGPAGWGWHHPSAGSPPPRARARIAKG